MSRVSTRTFDALVTQTDETQEEAFATETLSAVKTEPTSPEEKKVALQVIHTGLTKLVFIRRMIEERLEGRSLELVRGDALGLGGKKRHIYWIRIDPALDLDEAAPFARAPPGSRIQSLIGLFSHENSKMACPSFALPAGALEIGGSCPGAGAAQTVVPENIRAQHEKGVGEKVNVPNTICGSCYASVGTSFQHGTVQLQELVRYWWIAGLLRERDGEERLADMLEAALRGEIAFGWPTEHHLGKDLRFFRLHDSGDFFSVGYARAWIEVARRLPDVMIWAPTRTWAAPGFRKFWGTSSLPENLIVRPSAYHFNDASPDIIGLAAGTTSLYAVEGEDGRKTEQKDPSRADWNCQVYRADQGEHNCMAAERPTSGDDATPSGKKGCRTCWVFPRLSVNYTAHAIIGALLAVGLAASLHVLPRYTANDLRDGRLADAVAATDVLLPLSARGVGTDLAYDDRRDDGIAVVGSEVRRVSPSAALDHFGGVALLGSIREQARKEDCYGEMAQR